jgi:hypothetical protein
MEIVNTAQCDVYALLLSITAHDGAMEAAHETDDRSSLLERRKPLTRKRTFE